MSNKVTWEANVAEFNALYCEPEREAPVIEAHSDAAYLDLLDAMSGLAARRAAEANPELARQVRAINAYYLFEFEDYREVLREWQKRIWYQQCVLRGALRLAMRDAEQPRGWKRIKEAA